MSCECGKEPFVLLRGYSSRWDGVDWMSITFKSDTKVDFTGFSAKFKIGNYTFTNNDLSQEWIINLTDEQTATLPLGPNSASLIVYDTIGEGKPFTTTVPILVKDWVDGDVTVDTYKATIIATLDNKKEFIVNVETAKVSLEWVNGKIAEHNSSELAHSYIQNLISNEEQARIDADNVLDGKIEAVSSSLSNYRTSAQQDIIDQNLQAQITANTNNFSNYRTSSSQDVIDNAQNTAISSKQNQLTQTQLDAVNSGINTTKVSAYDNHIANTTIHVTAQEKQTWNNKQNAIQDLDTIRSGASAGATAVQPNDMAAAISTHNTSSQAHEDIRGLITNETTNRENADIGLQSQIDAIVASSDVTDIVGTYAELQAYDTSSLPPNSIIKVLQDESQNDETTYYRWVINGGVGSWVLIGEEGPYYTKSEADGRFATAAQGAKADTAVQPSALNNYVTLNTVQRMTAAKEIVGIDSGTGAQTNIFCALSTQTSTQPDAWKGRMMVGAKNITFLMGVYNGMAGLGAHGWTDSASGTGASWADFYMNPDGDKTVYIGGNSWTRGSGWFKVQNSGSNSNGKIQINIGTITNGNWKDVAYKGENLSDFNNDSGYITLASLSGYATETWVSNQGYLTTSDIVSSVDSSSTNSKAVGAKLFYDTCGDIEATLNAIRGV